MSLTKISSIPTWFDPHLFNPDDAGPIGVATARESVTLTEILVDGRILRFGEETDPVRILKHREIRLELPEVHAAGIVKLKTIEFETRNKELLGKTIVLAYRPLACDWFGTAKVKSVNRASTSERTKIVADALRAVLSSEKNRVSDYMLESQLWEILAAKPQDLFGHEDRYYARLHGYDQVDTTILSGDEDFSDLPSQYKDRHPNRRPARELEIAYGLVTDFDSSKALLQSSELLQESIGLLDGSTLSDVNKEEIHTPRTVVPGKGKIPVGETAFALAKKAWHASMIKALAGPDKSEKQKLQNSHHLVREFGEVAVLAKWIFEDTMINLVKRFKEPGLFVDREKMPKKRKDY